MNHPLIPAPLRLDAPAGAALTVTPGTTVARGPELAGVVDVFLDDIARDTGLALTAGPAHTSGTDVVVRVELVTSGPAADELAVLPEPGGLRADDGDPAAERYGLEVLPTHVRVWAATPEGAHRGLTSLRQLLTAGLRPDGTAELPPLRVLDAPRYAWRGLSLDVARTFHDADQVLRVLDILSLHKLNVLHLHLTDDQGWRVPITGWPALTEIGGAGALGDRPGGWYTTGDIDRIVDHARQRFITVVPEIDMPGHCQAVFRSYPELAPAGPAVEDAGPIPVGTLDPDREITWRFVRDVLVDVARLFPGSAYLHLGGDEAFGMPDEAHTAFVDRARDIARSLGRKAVGWQETARSAVGPEDVVQYWIEATEMRQALDSGALAQMMPEPMAAVFAEMMAKAEHDVDRAAVKGARVLLSPTSHLYLDRPYAEPAADADGETRRARVGLPVYPSKTIEQIYDWDPDLALTAATDTEATAAGVEAAVWCETVTSGEDLEFLLLPRLAGIAERAWSPAGTGKWDDHRGRLAVQSAAWRCRGWTWFASTLVDWPAHAVRGDEAA